MKTSGHIALGGLALAFTISSVGVQSAADYAVVERGPHHRVWARVSWATNRLGQAVAKTNTFTELATGLHRWQGTRWEEASTVIESFPGGAIARQGQHQVVFASDFATAGAIDLQTPDGKRLRSHLVGLGYYDEASGKSVLFAEVTNSPGVVVPPNQVVYAEAFSGVRASVRYTYTLAGLEQDVVLEEQPPAPELFGLNAKSSRLQVFTEFLSPPAPLVREEANATTRELPDPLLDFGVMKMGRGLAFPTRVEEGTAPDSVPVGKRWQALDGRQFLIEEVRVSSVASQLEALPAKQAATSMPVRQAAVPMSLPVRDGTIARPSRPMELAKLESPARGFVLDYTLMTSETNFTFHSDTTYYVSGLVNLSGTTTIEAAAIVKYTNTTSAKLNLLGTVDCQTDSARPAAFTAKDDDSVGQIITGSTGTPSGYYGLMLAGPAAALTLHDCRFLYGNRAITHSGNLHLTNVQFVACSRPIYVQSSDLTITVDNALFYTNGMVFDHGIGAVFCGQHLTVQQAGSIAATTGPVDCSIYLTNCLIAGLTSWGKNVEASYTNQVAWLTSGAGVFQNVAAGTHYLAESSPYRNAGTTNLGSYLLTLIQQTTTYPPPLSTVDTNTPDLGYHFPVLTDFDLDGMEDGWELAHGLNPLLNDANDDPDGDWSPNLQEYQAGTNPTDRMVVAWGNNGGGQCNVPLNLRNVTALAGGINHSLALQSDGTVTAWGDDTYGQTNVPPNLSNVVNIASGADHGFALRVDGTVTNWGAWWTFFGGYPVYVPSSLTNLVAIAAGADHDLALRNDGSVIAWSFYASTPYTLVPTNLPAAKAVAAGWDHSVALLTNGTVVAWGTSSFGATNVPADLSNVSAIVAGNHHTLALKSDGTVVAWGAGSVTNSGFSWDQGQSIVPAGLTNVVAISAGGYHSFALKNDGSVVGWGDLNGAWFAQSNIVAIGSGDNHGLALRSARLTPLIIRHPADQYLLSGANATFTAQGLGLAGVHYQWQFNGVDIAGATNSTYTLSSVSPTNDGSYRVIVSTGAGSVASSNANLAAITPPVITGMSLPTNRVCIYGNILSFNVAATASGQTNGFPVSYQWKWNGTNIAGATETAYSFAADDDSSGSYSVTVTNAAGSTNAYWQVTVTNAINVTNDLLLIYNTNSLDSSNVCAYYLAHRPLVNGANVLGIGCTNTESFLPSEYTNVFVAQVANWLAQNPTKRPQYVILFLDIPSRVNVNRPPPNLIVTDFGKRPSVSYSMARQFAGWQPFVMHLNMGTTNDCRAYIDKLEYFGTNYSPGKLVISANSAGSYGNTNYVLDGIRHHGNYTNGVVEVNSTFPSFVSDSNVVFSAKSGLLNAGVATNSILF